MRYFNTEGPVVADNHYCIPPLDRVDFDEILRLIEWKKYFVLHAPRQTGKTSMLLALGERLNADGRYRWLYINVEPTQAFRDDIASTIPLVLLGLRLPGVAKLVGSIALGISLSIRLSIKASRGAVSCPSGGARSAV